MLGLGDIRWNYYSASCHAPGKIAYLYPGSGGYGWQETRDFLWAMTQDTSTKMDRLRFEDMKATWESVQEGEGISVVYPHDHLGPKMFTLYGHEEGHDPQEAAWEHFMSLRPDMYGSLGMKSDFTVTIPDTRLETEEAVGRVELRIALLMEEAGFPRAAPVLYPTELRLKGIYDAVETNFNAVAALALSPLSSDEVKHEASFLAYSLGLLRIDLSFRAREMGIPAMSDPLLTWSRNASTSKEW